MFIRLFKCFSFGGKLDLHINEAPLGGGLSIPHPCNFFAKYPVSHKFRLQISRKLKYRPFFMLLATIYFILLYGKLRERAR